MYTYLRKILVMRDIFVISDTHFGHDNIIKFCERPFANPEEQDEALIENWNSVVKDSDIVYHLGDVYFGEGVSALPYLNGHKRLLLGNHDDINQPVLHTFFEKIMLWRMFPEFGLIFTHVPMHEKSWEMDKDGKNLVNVHGHIHNVNAYTDRHRNVCVEKINYTPISIEELRIK